MQISKKGIKLFGGSLLFAAIWTLGVFVLNSLYGRDGFLPWGIGMIIFVFMLLHGIYLLKYEDC